MNEVFHKIASKVSTWAGSSFAFMFSITIIAVWALTGERYDYNNTWQLVINTGTTIVTFLMVFLIQNTQNRDAKAIHLKLDELLKATKLARNRLVNAEELTDKELEELHSEFHELHEKAEQALLQRREKTTVTVEVSEK